MLCACWEPEEEELRRLVGSASGVCCNIQENEKRTLLLEVSNLRRGETGGHTYLHAADSRKKGIITLQECLLV